MSTNWKARYYWTQIGLDVAVILLLTFVTASWAFEGRRLAWVTGGAVALVIWSLTYDIRGYLAARKETRP